MSVKADGSMVFLGHQAKVPFPVGLTSEGTIFGPNGRAGYRRLLQFPPAKKAAGRPIAFTKHAEKVDKRELRPRKRHPRLGSCHVFRRRHCIGRLRR